MADKTTTENGKKRGRPKKQFLEGMTPPSIKEIDEAAEEYVATRNSRMRLLDLEVTLRDNLQLLMNKHKLKVYENSDCRVEFEETRKVKVKSKSEKEDES